jgi:putative transposase
VSDHQADYPIATMCRLLGVSSSGYHAWVKRQPSRRAETNAALTADIRAAHAASRGTYGAPRIHAELAANGIRVGRKRVARLMRQAGVAGVSRRRFVTTTVRGDRRQAPDLVDRDFTAEGPDRLWVADITYIPTWTGFLYLAVVLDAYSRRIVGWSMATTLASQLVLDALDMALQTRRPQGVIHHSDQGSQYTSIEFGQRCRDAGVRPSMGSVGDAGACPRAGVAGPGGQRDVREFLRYARMRAARAKPVQDTGRGAQCRVQLHRRFLQPATSPLLDRLSLADRVRTPAPGSQRRCRRTPACRRARGRQGQALRAAARGGRP